MMKKAALLVVIGLLVLTPAFAQAAPEDVVKNLVSPFVDLIALLLALAFGLGILGFIFLVMQGALKWTVGGGFGRSMAVQTFIRAAEVLAIIPLIYFIAFIMQSVGDPHIAQVAGIYTKLVEKGWSIIISALTA